MKYSVWLVKCKREIWLKFNWDKAEHKQVAAVLLSNWTADGGKLHETAVLLIANVQCSQFQRVLTIDGRVQGMRLACSFAPSKYVFPLATPENEGSSGLRNLVYFWYLTMDTDQKSYSLKHNYSPYLINIGWLSLNLRRLLECHRPPYWLAGDLSRHLATIYCFQSKLNSLKAYKLLREIENSFIEVCNRLKPFTKLQHAKVTQSL